MVNHDYSGTSWTSWVTMVPDLSPMWSLTPAGTTSQTAATLSPSPGEGGVVGVGVAVGELLPGEGRVVGVAEARARSPTPR